MKPDTPTTGTPSRGSCSFPSTSSHFPSQRLLLSGFSLPLHTEDAHRPHWRLLNQSKHHRASPSVLHAALPPGRNTCPFHQPISAQGFLFQEETKTQIMYTSEFAEHTPVYFCKRENTLYTGIHNHCPIIIKDHIEIINTICCAFRKALQPKQNSPC